jgi:hypothetical protein
MAGENRRTRTKNMLSTMNHKWIILGTNLGLRSETLRIDKTVTYVVGAFCNLLFPAHIKAIASRVGYGLRYWKMTHAGWEVLLYY